ncbi:MAG: TetR/AcrR family transcriptional regulator [Nostocoides sp.]
MRADALANRAAIVASARRQLGERGADVPLTAIAEDAGVGIATLYRHFPERDDLIVAVGQSVRDMIVNLAAHHAAQMEKDPHAVETSWVGFVHAFDALDTGSLLPALAQGRTADNLPPQVAEIRKTLMHAIESVLVPTRAAGVIRDSLTPVWFVLSMAKLTRPLPTPGLEQIDATIDLERHRVWLIEAFLRGIRPA